MSIQNGLSTKGRPAETGDSANAVIPSRIKKVSINYSPSRAMRSKIAAATFSKIMSQVQDHGIYQPVNPV